MVVRALGTRAGAAIALVLVAAPAAMRAATPTFGPGFPPPDPEPDRGAVGILETLVPVAALLLGLLAVLVMIRILGGLMAGTDRARPARHASAAGARPTTRAGGPAWGRLALVVVAGVVGILAGREIAYNQSVGGLGGTLNGTLITLGLVAAVGVLALAGLAGLGLRHGAPNRRIVNVFVAAGCLALGGFVGSASAGATGGTYRAPVELEAAGRTQATLAGEAITPTSNGLADCRSAPDSEAVAMVTALDLGSLGGGTLRGTIYLGIPEAPVLQLELWIDGADLPEGGLQPFWGGKAVALELTTGGTSGRLRFEGLERLPDAAKPDQSFTPQAWPAGLSGEIGWTCEPWP